MFSPTVKLKTPETFNFPHQPYKIQDDLMQSLYSVLDNKQIGIFESPTGTGKSLTLTCASIRWLLDYEELLKNELKKEVNKVQEEIAVLEENSAEKSDWIDSQFKSIQKKNELLHLTKQRDSINEQCVRMQELRERVQNAKKKKTKNFSNPIEKNSIIEDEDSDDERKEIQENKIKNTKIFFCSRTHSQLSQVVGEIKKIKHGNQLRCVTLASRSNLCINKEVRNLRSMNLINEKCLDMQKSNSKITAVDNDGTANKKQRLKISSKCPYKNENTKNFRDQILYEMLDIEDLVKTGEQLKCCPYYSCRKAIDDAQVIMLPYQMILHRKSRIQMGIDLRNNILIIDEAHNLIDTITSIYSSEINLFQLKSLLNQMTAYKLKYIKNFIAKNLLKINQIIFIIKRLIKMCSTTVNCENPRYRMLKTHELMSEGEFYNINIYHILEFCENTRFAQKINGFAQNFKPNQDHTAAITETSGTSNLLREIEENQKPISKKQNIKLKSTIGEKEVISVANENICLAIRPFLAFLESLTESAEDGQVLINYDTDEKKAGMKFCLMNPGGHFEQIIKECRSIIVAGGTMQPTTELTNQLFKNHLARLKLHFYDHVIPKESILPIIVPNGPMGKQFMFNFTNRTNKQLLTELGMTILNICNVVPAGIVCFIPSYDYLDVIFEHLKNEGILEKISNKKEIFREPKSSQIESSIEKLLNQYSVAIKNSPKSGAILFSVVGGKLSEGLNFADDLGRCVIVVGMPYANKNSPELQQKIKYLNSSIGNDAGNDYYENLCMKAVNQCIGRSVRHINDFASVLLLDERYAIDKTQNKLPRWIRGSLQVPKHFADVQKLLVKFFQDKQMNRSNNL